MMCKNEGVEFDQKILESVKALTWTAKNIPIRFLGDEILHRPCSVILKSEFNSEEIQYIAKLLVSNLTKYRKHTGMGRGLAANQIGFSRRIVVVWLVDKLEVLYNPKLIQSEGKGTYWESCISAGSMLIGEVHRPWKGIFEYQDEDGKACQLKADEKQTRLLLHEIDHLDGITCQERYEPHTIRFVRGGKNEVLSYPFRRLDT